MDWFVRDAQAHQLEVVAVIEAVLHSQKMFAERGAVSCLGTMTSASRPEDTTPLAAWAGLRYPHREADERSLIDSQEDRDWGGEDTPIAKQTRRA